MPPKILYTNPKGETRNSSSYSARAAFKFCKRKFKLTYIDGWREKRIGASLAYGHVWEAAVQWDIQHNGGGAERFVELWTAAKEQDPNFPKWQYTKLEGSWENMLTQGYESLKLFHILLPTFPFLDPRHAAPRFQIPLRKKIFPGTPEYDSLENTAYLDMLITAEANHPAFKRVPGWEKGSRRCIVDMKTAGKEIDLPLIVLDPQLVEYAWMAVCRDVGFLVGVKKSLGYKGGSRVYLFQDVGSYKAGKEMLVLDKAEDGDVWLGTNETMQAYDAATRVNGTTMKGKALDAACTMFLEFSDAVKVSPSAFTKQAIRFATGRISQERMEDEGKSVGQTTVEMVVAQETDFYPMESGIRYPAEKCNRCAMRFICADDPQMRDAKLIKVGEEWLDAGEYEDQE